MASAIMNLIGCAPQIYLLDRQTVLEDEAAGEWPQFEKDLVLKSAAQDPTPYPKFRSTREKPNCTTCSMVSSSLKRNQRSR